MGVYVGLSEYEWMCISVQVFLETRNSIELSGIKGSCDLLHVRPRTKFMTSARAASALETTKLFFPASAKYFLLTFMLGGQHRVSLPYRRWPQPRSPHSLPASACKGLELQSGATMPQLINIYLLSAHQGDE